MHNGGKNEPSMQIIAENRWFFPIMAVYSQAPTARETPAHMILFYPIYNKVVCLNMPTNARTAGASSTER